MNSVDKKLPGLEEREFVWTVQYQAMTQKSVRKADTNDQDSEDQKCFSDVTVKLGDCVIKVECAKQDVFALSAILSESYTGGARTIHTNFLDTDRIERCMTKLGMMIAGAWAGGQLPVVSGTGVTIGEDLFGVSQLDDGCCVARHRWDGTAPLCVCAVFDPHLLTGNVHVTREPEVVRQPSGMALRSIINHAKGRTCSLSWSSGDQLGQLMEIEGTVLSTETGTVIAPHCHHEWEANQV